jgi:hypothetical protein
MESDLRFDPVSHPKHPELITSLKKKVSELYEDAKE